MTAAFLSLDTPKAWGLFNAHLGNLSYVGGCQPTAEDVEVYKAVSAKGGPLSRFAHVVRWYNHLNAIGTEPTAWPVELRSEDCKVAEQVEDDENAEETS